MTKAPVLPTGAFAFAALRSANQWAGTDRGPGDGWRAIPAKLSPAPPAG